jgi:hypothetical protein
MGEELPFLKHLEKTIFASLPFRLVAVSDAMHLKIKL